MGAKLIAQQLQDLGFKVIATSGTQKALAERGIKVERVNKVAEGRPNIVDMMKNGGIALIVNTVGEKRSTVSDSRHIRTTAVHTGSRPALRVTSSGVDSFLPPDSAS